MIQILSDFVYFINNDLLFWPRQSDVEPDPEPCVVTTLRNTVSC